MVARRMSSDQSNDPLMSSSTFDTSVLGSASKDRVSFPLYDGHGNTIATLSRHNGGYQVANVKKYDVWGKVRSDSETGSSGQILNTTQRYCGNLGHKFDSTSGLVYMRARYYEAETGRFISEDPARHGANWYVYCRNSPVIGVDPSGTEDTMDYNALALQLFSIGRILMSTGVVSLGAAVMSLRVASIKYMMSAMDDTILLGVSVALKVQACTQAAAAAIFCIGATKRIVAGMYLEMASKYLDALGEDGLEYANQYIDCATETLGIQNSIFGL